MDGNCDAISLSQGKSPQSQPKISRSNSSSDERDVICLNNAMLLAMEIIPLSKLVNAGMLHVGNLKKKVRIPSLRSRENKPWIEPSSKIMTRWWQLKWVFP